MNKTVIGIIVLILAIIGGFFLFRDGNNNTTTEALTSSQLTGVMIDSGQTVVIQGHRLPKEI